MIFNLNFLTCAKSAALIEDKIYHYRITPGSLTHTFRLDRFDKYIQLYEFLKNWGKINNMSNEYYFRIIRLTIGHCRKGMSIVVNSSLPIKEKIKWLQNVMKSPIWDEMKSIYPYKKLPIVHYLPFILSVKKKSILFYLICKIK